MYGLENAYGYDRGLAVWLIQKGYFVKDVNPALSFAQRKSVPMYQKNDSYDDDDEAVALVLINKLDTLPDAVPDDAYWTLSQLMCRGDTIKTHQVRLKNQLHEQLCTVYPSYKQFFSDINCQTARYFFQEYPSPEYLNGKTVEGLEEELRVPRRAYQSARDTITNSIICDLQHYNEQLKEVEQALKKMYPEFECTLMTTPGIDLVTACKLLSEIGDIKRFPNTDKLAKFAGVAPVKISSSGKGGDFPSKQGNRRLQAIFYFLAIQMIQVSVKGTARNTIFREYYLRRKENGKSSQQALICIAPRLINIVYGMLKNKTEYKDPNMVIEKPIDTAV